MRSAIDTFSVQKATLTDIPEMVILSDQKRKAYEKEQPQFWKRSNNANAEQITWFTELLKKEDYLLFVAKDQTGQVQGFVIAQWVKVPEVYNPGTTLMIDDFCVKEPSVWQSIGGALLSKLKEFKAEQIIIVCGYHDQPRSTFLEKSDLSAASKWYVGAL